MLKIQRSAQSSLRREREDAMIARFERFSLAIAEISRSWHRLAAQEMERHVLKGPHAVYLTALYGDGDGATAAQLCERCGKDKADVSRMLSILEKKGLVCKESGGTGGYRARLHLTQEGRAAAEQVQRAAVFAVEQASRGVTDAEREVFYRVIETIAGNLSALSLDEPLYENEKGE
jgi:DNA-binding MarR family transcriptional regulator